MYFEYYFYIIIKIFVSKVIINFIFLEIVKGLICKFYLLHKYQYEIHIEKYIKNCIILGGLITE